MPLSTQDFLHGVDMTGLNPAAAADFNNLVDQCSPFNDGQPYQGKGIVLITKDTALNTPDVPNASLTAKWKSYLWVRVPAVGSLSPQAHLYSWNDDNVNDPTLLKWSLIAVDLTSLQNQITTLTNSLATTSAQANAAYALATAVNALATNANANANAAVTTANNASASAATANNTANATAGQLTSVQTAVTNATNTANAANTAATAAQASVNAFVAAHNIAIVAETAGNGVNLAGIGAGVQQRTMNNELYDGNNIVTLAAGKITITNAGTYVFDITVPYVPDLTGANSQRAQAYLIKDSDNSVLAIGQSSAFEFTGTAGVDCKPTLMIRIMGVIVATSGEVVRIDFKAESGNGLLGRASGRGTTEIYTLCRIEQIA